jgi:hypothetical protein
MKQETPRPNTEAPSLTDFELGLFLDGLKQAAEHSIGAERISQLPGFEGLSEKDRAIVSQRADHQRADLLLRRLEDEWSRKCFDQLIAPKLRSDSRLDLGRKYEADGIFRSVLDLASERKWETLEKFVETATTSGKRQAYKQWRRGEGSSAWNTSWQILCGTIELVLVGWVLISIDRGFPAIIASLLILVYVILSYQIAAVGFIAFLDLASATDRMADTAEEVRIKTARNLSRQAIGAKVRAIFLALIEATAIVALIGKGLL